MGASRRRLISVVGAGVVVSASWAPQAADATASPGGRVLVDRSVLSASAVDGGR
jgi:predicted ATPase